LGTKRSGVDQVFEVKQTEKYQEPLINYEAGLSRIRMFEEKKAS